MKAYIKLLATMALVIVTAACNGGQKLPETRPVVRLMTHDSFDMSADLLAAFEEETGIQVQVFKAGDGGEMVNKAILSKRRAAG